MAATVLATGCSASKEKDTPPSRDAAQKPAVTQSAAKPAVIVPTKPEPTATSIAPPSRAKDAPDRIDKLHSQEDSHSIGSSDTPPGQQPDAQTPPVLTNTVAPFGRIGDEKPLVPVVEPPSETAPTGTLANPLRGSGTQTPRARPLPPAQKPEGGGEPPGGPPPLNISKAEQPKQPEPPPQRPAKRSGIPFDPLKENGPIFVGWSQPKLAIIITGRQDGYLEPCGCAGLDRMKGGLSRRHTFLKERRAEGWPVVAVDVGGLSKGFGQQAELKFQTAVGAMRKIGYDAIGLGGSDLQLPAGELVAEVTPVAGQKSPFVSANVALFGFQADLTPKMRMVEAGGVKVGFTAVLGEPFRQQLHNAEIETVDPAVALKDVVPQLKKQADYLILLAYTGTAESVALAKQFPDFRLVVTAGGGAEPPAKPGAIEGSGALLVEVGEKAENAIVVGLFDDPKQPWRYQRVPLDSRFPASPDMKMLMTAYQDQLKALGFAGLNVRAVSHPLQQTNGAFVGSQKCQSCHEESYRVWKKSHHAQAFETLVKADPPRNFDPECLSCHVTGWNPQNFFPYESGYQGVDKKGAEKTPHLINVGCENCHGPGGAHCAAEEGADIALQKKLQQALVITKDEAADAKSKKQNCYTCHDLDNSPDFDFNAYWPEVEHYEDK